MRKFADEVVIPEAQAHEKSGKRPSTELIKRMGDLHINAMVRLFVSLLVLSARSLSHRLSRVSSPSHFSSLRF